jgi:MFS family permease
MMTDTQYSSFRWYIFFTMIIVTATTSMALIAPASLFGPRLFAGAMPDLTSGQIIWACMGIFNFFLGVAALIAGSILDKFGPIKVFIGGLLLVMAGAILMPIYGTTYWGMIFIRLLQGAGTGPIMAASVPVAAAYFPANERSIATGAQGFSVALGIIIGLQWVPRLADKYGDCFVAMRVLAFVGIIGLVLSLIAAFGPKASQDSAGAAGGEQDAKASQYFKKALVNPMTWVAILCFTLMSGIFQQFNSLVVPYISSPVVAEAGNAVGLGIDPNGMFAQNTLTFAIAAFCLGSFIGGFITEKVFGGKGRPVIAIGFLLGAILAFSTKYDFISSNQDVLRTVMIVTAFFFSMVNPQTQSYLAKNYPKEIGGKLGGLAMFVGIVIGSTLAVKWLEVSVDKTLSYMQPITIMAGLCFAGFVLSLFLKNNPNE